MFLHQKYETRSMTTLHSCSELQDRLSAIKITRTVSFHQTEVLSRMNSLLTRKVRNKKCYAFQVLKQFILFSDSSCTSSSISVSKYDALIFSDEKLHTLQKILETQLLECKIWAFINLKVNRKREQIRELAQKSEIVVKKVGIFQKQQGFRRIQETGTQIQKQRTLSKHLVYNYSFHNAPSSKYLEAPQKSTRLQYSSISKRTIQTERDGRSAMKSMKEMKSVAENCCQGCNCYLYCCCCASYSYNLEQRIQYLKRLEQMVSLKQRSALYK